MTLIERNNKLKNYITCLKCEISGKLCDDNCSTQYDAGNMGEIIENLEALSKILEQELNYSSVNSLVESKLKNPKAKTFDVLHFIADNAGLSTYEAIEKAYNMGVSKKEPCEDCVSRQAVIDMTGLSEWFDSSDSYNEFVIALSELPPVTPKGVTITDFADKCRECGKQKKGKWICVHHLENKITYDSWKCSECQHDFSSEEESVVDFDEYKYCPNCGAKMEG